MPIDQMHKCRFMEERKHAIEILEEVFQQRQCLISRRKRHKNWPRKQITENLRLPENPFIVIGSGRGYHVLEGIIARFLAHPLNAFGREYRKPGRGSCEPLARSESPVRGNATNIFRFAAIVRHQRAHHVRQGFDFLLMFLWRIWSSRGASGGEYLL